MSAPLSSPPRLVVVGAINVDLTARVQRAPAPGETVTGGILSRQPGGKGANQAAAAAKLGADVRLVGAVGADESGDEMLRNLAAAGVDAAGVQRVREATGTALIVVDDTGENSIVVCPGANTAVVVDDVPDVAGAAVLAQLEVDVAVVERVAFGTEGFFALNVSPVQPLPPALLDRVDLFIVNEGEYAQSPELRSRPLVAITLGAEGAILLRDGVEIARAKAPATSVVSSVGAGDAFAAALTVALLSGHQPQPALVAACAVGAAAVADPQSQPDLERLEAYLPQG
jgi:ribokinase